MDSHGDLERKQIQKFRDGPGDRAAWGPKISDFRAENQPGRSGRPGARFFEDFWKENPTVRRTLLQLAPDCAVSMSAADVGLENRSAAHDLKLARVSLACMHPETAHIFVF